VRYPTVGQIKWLRADARSVHSRPRTGADFTTAAEVRASLASRSLVVSARHFRKWSNTMINTSAAIAASTPTDVPGYPMSRAGGCPFDPAPALRELAATAPITRVRIWNDSTPWLISCHEDVRELLKDPRVSAATDHPSLSVLRTEHVHGESRLPHHGRPRARSAATVRDQAVHDQARRGDAAGDQKIVDDVIEAMLAGPNPADLVKTMAYPVPARVICELLGVPYADDDFLQNRVEVMVDPASTGEVSKAARRELLSYLEQAIADKRADPGTTCSRIWPTNTSRAGALSEREAAMLGLLLVIAGHETTANMITLGTLALLENPDQLAILRAIEDPDLIAGAVEELLRYLTIPQSGRRRVAVEDIEIGGVLIRAGDGLILASDLANRDESVFDDPDRLDLRRHARPARVLRRWPAPVPWPAARPGRVADRLSHAVPTDPHAAPRPPLDQIPFKQPGESIYGVCELPVTW